jgi:hypothetical protein
MPPATAQAMRFCSTQRSTGDAGMWPGRRKSAANDARCLQQFALRTRLPRTPNASLNIPLIGEARWAMFAAETSVHRASYCSLVSVSNMQRQVLKASQ